MVLWYTRTSFRLSTKIAENMLFEGFACFTKATPHQEPQSATAKLAWAYPESFNSILEEFKDMSQFCFPDSNSFKLAHPDLMGSDSYSFVLTSQNGNRLYCVCMKVFLSGNGGRFEYPRRTQVGLCVASRVPLINAMVSMARQIHGLSMLENCIMNIPFSQSSACALLHDACKILLQDMYNYPVGGEKFDIACYPANQIHMFRPFSVQVPAHGGQLHKEVSIVALFDALGVDKFLHLLSAVLNERRVLVVSDKIATASAAVLACAAMIYPFKWHHILIPSLPAKLHDYVAAPMPYLIGTRRTLLQKFKSEVLDEVVIVDIDNGEITTSSPIKDFVGDSGSTFKLVSENFDRAKAKAAEYASKFMARSSALLSGTLTSGKGHSIMEGTKEAQAETQDQGPKDVAGYIVSELRKAYSARPSAVSLTAVVGMLGANSASEGSGTSPSEQTIEKWLPETERILRENIRLLFVYLFGNLEDYKTLSKSGFGRSSAQNRNVPVSFNGNDVRGAFDIPSFLNYRQHMGDSKSLHEFTTEFMHTQMFERYCAELIHKQPHERSRDEFFAACKELSDQHISSVTVSAAISAVLASRQCTGDSLGMITSLASDVHGATMQWTSGSLPYPSAVGASIDIFGHGPVYANPDYPLTNSNASFVNLALFTGGIIERICAETFTTEGCRKIINAIEFRLRELKSSMGNSIFGNLITNKKLISGWKTLELLFHLLTNGSESVISFAIGILPLLRSIVRASSDKAEVHHQEDSSTAGSNNALQAEVRFRCQRVVRLLLDVPTLVQHRRSVKFSFRSGAVGKYGAAQVMKQKQDILFDGFNTKSGAPFFEGLHYSFKPANCHSINPASVRITTPTRVADLDDENEENPSVDSVSVSPAPTARSTTSPVPRAKSPIPAPFEIPMRSVSSASAASNVNPAEVAAEQTAFVPPVASSATASVWSDFESEPAEDSQKENPFSSFGNSDWGSTTEDSSSGDPFASFGANSASSSDPFAAFGATVPSSGSSDPFSAFGPAPSGSVNDVFAGLTAPVPPPPSIMSSSRSNALDAFAAMHVDNTAAGPRRSTAPPPAPAMKARDDPFAGLGGF